MKKGAILACSVLHREEIKKKINVAIGPEIQLRSFPIHI